MCDESGYGGISCKGGEVGNGDEGGEGFKGGNFGKGGESIVAKRAILDSLVTLAVGIIVITLVSLYPAMAELEQNKQLNSSLPFRQSALKFSLPCASHSLTFCH